MRKGTLLTAIGVVVLVGAAAAVRFVALPALHRLPANLDTTVQLSGTADLLDEAAWETGDLSRVLRADVPVTVRQRVRVASTDGRSAVVVDETTMAGPDQTKLLDSSHTWSVDRVTLRAAPRPAGASAQSHDGLVVGFPLSPQPRDYSYWDTSTEAAAPARYQRAERHADRDTYVYETHASGPLKDPETLATMPSALSKEALLGFAASLGPAERELLASLAGVLPERIPLSYTATSDTTFWVDIKTGYVVDVRRKQTVAVSPPGGFSGFALPIESTLELAYTPDSVAAARDGAAEAERGLFLLGTAAPLGLLLCAAVLAIVAVWLSARGRRRRPPTNEPAAAVDAMASR